MAELKDVVQELVEKTKSGELEWDPSERSWITEYRDCTFVVFTNGQMRFRSDESGLVELGSADQNLTSLLASMAPYKPYPLDEALKIALECLTPDRSLSN